MIYRGPGFLRSHDSTPRPPPFPISWLSLFLSLPLCRRSSLLMGEGEGGGRRTNQIIRPWETLTLYNSSNTLWYEALVRNSLQHVLSFSLYLYRKNHFSRIFGKTCDQEDPFKTLLLLRERIYFGNGKRLTKKDWTTGSVLKRYRFCFYLSRCFVVLILFILSCVFCSLSP